MREILIKGQRAFLPEELQGHYEAELERCEKWLEYAKDLIGLVKCELKVSFDDSVLYRVLTGQEVLSNGQSIENVPDFVQYLNEKAITEKYPSEGSLKLDMRQALAIFKLDIPESLIRVAHNVFAGRTMEFFSLEKKAIKFTGSDDIAAKFCFVLNEAQIKAYDSLLKACEHLTESFDMAFASWPPISYLSNLFCYEGEAGNYTFSPNMSGINRASHLF